MTNRIKMTGGLLLGASFLLSIGFCIGQTRGPANLAAQQDGAVVPASGSAPMAEPTKRVVAYVYGNYAITREEFGDYLISVYAAERLELYVNKRIIEIECAKAKIPEVTLQEIDAQIADDCKRINIEKADFLRNILRQRYQKTLDEWRYDVIKPRLMLAKLCRAQIVENITEEDLQKMFKNRYGEKARVKIVLWPKEQKHLAEKYYEALRAPGTPNNPDASWDAVATKQPDANLAARAGEIEPIGRYSGSNSSAVEEIAFGLKVGEISRIIEVEGLGSLVVKRVGTVEPAKNIVYEKERDNLRKEVLERKLEKEVPLIFKKMRDQAKPNILVKTNVMAPLPEPENAVAPRK